jgi:hypothetical protein
MMGSDTFYARSAIQVKVIEESHEKKEPFKEIVTRHSSNSRFIS